MDRPLADIPRGKQHGPILSPEEVGAIVIGILEAVIVNGKPAARVVKACLSNPKLRHDNPGRAVIARRVLGSASLRARLEFELCAASLRFPEDVGASWRHSPKQKLVLFVAIFVLRHEQPRLSAKDSERFGAKWLPGLSPATLRSLEESCDDGLTPLQLRWPACAEERLAAEHSLPRWLARLWINEFAPLMASRLADATNLPAGATLCCGVGASASGFGGLGVLDCSRGGGANPGGDGSVGCGCASGRGSLVSVGSWSRSAVAAALAADGIVTAPTSFSPFGLCVVSPAKPNLWGSRAWRAGAFEVQDEGSQLIALATGARPGDVVVDLCCGRGGKTVALAHMVAGAVAAGGSDGGGGGGTRGGQTGGGGGGSIGDGGGRVIAHDVDERALADLQPRLRRHGLDWGCVSVCVSRDQVKFVGGRRGANGKGENDNCGGGGCDGGGDGDGGVDGGGRIGGVGGGGRSGGVRGDSGSGIGGGAVGYGGSAGGTSGYHRVTGYGRIVANNSVHTSTVNGGSSGGGIERIEIGEASIVPDLPEGDAAIDLAALRHAISRAAAERSGAGSGAHSSFGCLDCDSGGGGGGGGCGGSRCGDGCGVGGADVVLVDAPCSSLGTLRHGPNVRWEMDPAALRRFPPLQLAILRTAAQLVRPGGVLVYATCTLSRAENEAVAARFEREFCSAAAPTLPRPLPPPEATPAAAAPALPGTEAPALPGAVAPAVPTVATAMSLEDAAAASPPQMEPLPLADESRTPPEVSMATPTAVAANPAAAYSAGSVVAAGGRSCVGCNSTLTYAPCPLASGWSVEVAAAIFGAADMSAAASDPSAATAGAPSAVAAAESAEAAAAVSDADVGATAASGDEGAVEATKECRSWALRHTALLLPHVHGTDGFFIARWRRMA